MRWWPAAAALIFGYKQVDLIKSQTYESASTGTASPTTGGGTPTTGGGGGGGSIPSTGGGGAPSTGGKAATSAGGSESSSASVRAYVVQSDIQDAQTRESEIQNRARFE